MKRTLLVLSFLLVFGLGYYTSTIHLTPAHAAGTYNQEAVAFLNQYVRPMSEDVRGTKYRMEAFLARWAVVQSLIPNDGTVLDDGRLDEGVHQLTGADVYMIEAIVEGMNTTLSTQGYMTYFEKACVRAPGIQ
jgi:hypothetical protein